MSRAEGDRERMWKGKASALTERGILKDNHKNMKKEFIRE